MQKAATARDGGDQGRSGISEPYKLTRKEPEATPEQGGCSAGDGCLGWVGSSEAVSVHAGKGHTSLHGSRNRDGFMGLQGATGKTKPLSASHSAAPWPTPAPGHKCAVQSPSSGGTEQSLQGPGAETTL